MHFPNDYKNVDVEALSACADTLAEQYRRHLRVNQQPAGLPVAWRGLLKNLQTVCPGFSEIEYGIALNRAFISSVESDR